MMNFIAYSCNQCDQLFTQKKYLCPSCRHDTFSEQEVSGKGKVYTHTKIHISSPEFQHLSPYNVALIELEQGLKLTGRINDEIQIGDQVELHEKTNGAYIFKKL
jgi:uncharacterized protein